MVTDVTPCGRKEATPVMMSPRAAALAFAAFLGLAGCSGVQVRRATVLVCLRDRTERLVDSHVLSKLTTAVLDRDGVSVAAAKHAPGAAAHELVELGDPDPPRLLALAELCY